ncbi:MAG: hypothetical protein VB061_07395 [Christensenella sp.]|nr:hypothetical protein [Christensenella sp.]
MEIGTTNFEGVECTYARDWKTIYLSPQNQSDFFRLDLSERRGFLIKLINNHDITVAYISNVEYHMMNSYKLNAEFLFKYTLSDPNEPLNLTGMKLTGNEIDAIYSPVWHFYRATNKGSIKHEADLLYASEKVESFRITIESKPILIEFYIGDILSEGITGDNKLHTQIIISFDKTDDILFAYKVYAIVVRFLQMLLYKQEVGFQYIEIFRSTEEYEKSLLGHLWTEKNSSERIESLENYYLQPFYQKIMQTLANDEKSYLKHLPQKQQAFPRYEAIDILTAFSAFEYECHMDKATFIQKADCFSEVKKESEEFFNILETKYSDEKYTGFFKSMKEKIKTVGNEYGEKQRLINAYNICKNVLSSASTYSIPSDITKAAERIVEMRNKAIHHSYFPSIDDYDNKCIRLLHTICYAMFLRRVAIPDYIAELTLDDVFHCNGKIFSIPITPTPRTVDPNPHSTDV